MRWLFSFSLGFAFAARNAKFGGIVHLYLKEARCMESASISRKVAAVNSQGRQPLDSL
jgi:hypothetical protein